MAETEGAATPQEQAAQVKMNVLGQFVRDLSFENILAQKGITGDLQPDIQVQVALAPKKRPTENQYDISMKLNITSKAKEGDDVFFVLELDYVGIFHVSGVPDEQLHPFLMIECPRMLFPFARRVVSDVTRDGGFPPLNLEQIDFVALYRQQLTAAAQAQAAAKGEKKLDA